jgi:predicted RNA-binding Zn-ribbon protein involved in translation (DUF1610 family)
MNECRHHQLVLLPQNHKRLRCRRCHLTLTAEELGSDYCPECFETSGIRHDDFEALEWTEEARYRCEQCGAAIEYRPHEK